MALLDDYLDLVKDYKFSELFNTWSFLACISACLERRCSLNEHAIGYLYPNLYVVFVGPPAARKTTTARVPVDNFIRTLENGPIVCSNQLTPAALIDELKEASQKRYEHKTSPLFVVAGEFGVWFKDIGGGSMVDLLLDFYDSRKPGEIWRKNTKKWGQQEMPNPALTLLGCTTPKEIISSRIGETAGLGFTSRVVFVCEPRFIPGTTKFHPLDEKKRQYILGEFKRMNEMHGPFTLGEGTEQTISDMIDRNNQWMLDHPGTTIMSNYMSRKPVQIRKVAMCISAARSSRKIISPEDVLKAESLLDALEPTMPHAFGMQISYRDPGLASKIMDRIPIIGTISDKQLMHSFYLDGQAVPNNHELSDVIGGLLRAGAISITYNEKGEAFYGLKVKDR